MRRGLSPSRTGARDLVARGRVLVAGSPADKPARMVSPAEPLRLLGEPPPFVSRAGAKLAGALDELGVDVEGLRCLDAGASTGGFTDCLLQRGASAVTAVDVGRGQLHDRLRRHPRVEARERTDVRDLAIDGPGAVHYDLVVADLAFISLRPLASRLLALTAPGGQLLVLVKPQFEVGRRHAAAGRGVVTDPSLWAGALRQVAAAFADGGGEVAGIVPASVRGAAGNVEFLLHVRVGDPGPARSGARAPAPASHTRLEDQVAAAVARAVPPPPGGAGEPPPPGGTGEPPPPGGAGEPPPSGRIGEPPPSAGAEGGNPWPS